MGYKVRGLRGAAAALLGVVLPSFVILLTIALFFADVRHNLVVDAAFKGMRPAVVALIIGPVISLARGMHWAMFAVVPPRRWPSGDWLVADLHPADRGGRRHRLGGVRGPADRQRNNKPKA